jgi:ABC-2 type transport system ATP-binding protein
MPDPILQTERLTKDYRRFRALDALDLAVAAGEVFGLLGPNGSGKSTALRLVMGFLRPTAGVARVAGHDCWSQSVAVRRNVAYLPGELRLYENMTGRQVVEFLARLRGQGVDGEVTRLARRFDIDLSRPLTNLSSGMKRKVALLSVLVPRVPLLILDEPTNTLDPTMRDELFALIREAKGWGQTIVFSSHVLSEVESVCDRVGILRAGRLVHLQSLGEVQQTRLVRIRLSQALDAWPQLDGARPASELGREVAFEQTGPPGPLFAWLGTQSVEAVRVESEGLAPVYHRYHGGAA